MRFIPILSAVTGIILTLSSGARAAKPEPWQMNFQEAASPVMEKLVDFHDMLLVIITLISVFVLGLLIYVCIRFSEKNNPTPSKTTHNTLLEVVWTGIPVLILVFIGFFSFKILYYSDENPNAEMTLKVVGYQWYWGYEYPDHGISEFESRMIEDKDIKEGQLRLLEVDNRVILPIDTVVRVQTTAADVIHSWAMPALGVKKDAVPGRLNETWLKINKPGVYYGQCSELCGAMHAFMPVVIEAVSKEEFQAWVKEKNPSYGNAINETSDAKNEVASQQKQ